MLYKGILKYGALTTKVAGMTGKMLSIGDYEELANKKSVQEAVNYIKTNTAYGEVLKSVTGEIHRETLENILKYSLFNDYMKLIKYIGRDDMRFIIMAMSRYEIQILKTVIRNCIENNNTDNFLYGFPEEYENTLSFNSSKMISAKNMEDVMEALEGSPYYKVLSILFARGGKPTLFEIETNLDIYYFSTLWRVIERCFKGESKKQMEDAIGTEADILNILWIFRCKRYYNLPNEHVYALLLPVRYKLSNKTIQNLVETTDFQEFTGKLTGTKYGKMVESGSRTLYEKVMMKLITDIFRKIKNVSPYNITTVLGYMYAKELELENICSVIEGVRYSLSKEKIMEYVM